MSLTALEIYRKLPQANCAKYLLPSRLEFAAALIDGPKRLRKPGPHAGNGGRAFSKTHHFLMNAGGQPSHQVHLHTLPWLGDDVHQDAEHHL
jgi:hypothetical protein